MNMEQENNKEKLGPEFLHSNEYQEKMKVKHDQTQNRVNKFPMIMHCLVILFFMAYKWYFEQYNHRKGI